MYRDSQFMEKKTVPEFAIVCKNKIHVLLLLMRHLIPKLAFIGPIAIPLLGITPRITYSEQWDLSLWCIHLGKILSMSQIYLVGITLLKQKQKIQTLDRQKYKRWSVLTSFAIIQKRANELSKNWNIKSFLIMQKIILTNHSHASDTVSVSLDQPLGCSSFKLHWRGLNLSVRMRWCWEFRYDAHFSRCYLECCMVLTY